MSWEAWGIRGFFQNLCTCSLYTWREIVSNKNQVPFKKVFDRVIKSKTQQNKFKSHCHLRCNDCCALSSIWKIQDSLFQNLVQAFRLPEAEETILIFDKYSDNQKFFLKQQERINRATNGTVSVYVWPIKNVLKTQKIRLNSLTVVHNTSSKTKSARNWNAEFSSRDVTYRINSR